MEFNYKAKQFDPRDLLSIIWKRKWLIAIPVVMISVLAYFGSNYLTPVYRSSVTIAIGSQVMLSNELQRLTGYSGEIISPRARSSDERRQIEKSLQNEITSTPVLTKLVYALNMTDDPALDQRAMELHKTHPDLSTEDIKINILSHSLKNRISIELVGNNQVMISITSVDPKMAQTMADKIGTIFMNDKREQVIKSVYSSLDFSYEQLEKYEKDLQDKIDQRTSLEEKYMKLQMQDPVNVEQIRKNVRSEIQTTEMKIDELNEAENEMLGQLSSLPKSKLNLKESSYLIEKKREIGKLYTNLANRLKTDDWSAPPVIDLNEKILDLEQKIDNEIESIVNGNYSDLSADDKNRLIALFKSQTGLDIMNSKKASFQRALSEVENRVALMPEHKAELDRLDREINAAREFRDEFKRQLEGFQISQAILGQSKISLIEPAKVPFDPIYPNRMKIVVMALMMGLVLGGVLAILSELFDASIKNVDKIKDELGLNVLGTIPKITNMKKVIRSGKS